MSAQTNHRRSKIEDAYWSFSQRPLQSLVFLLPFVLAYELALPILGTDSIRNVSDDITARHQLRSFFEWLGVSGYYLPGLIVTVVLLCWHMARRDPWKVNGRYCLIMAAESAILAVPLFVFMLLLVRHPMVSASLTSTEIGTWREPMAQLMFAVGAGLYEELLFRLIAIAVFHVILVDLLALPANIGAGATIALSAVAFSLYHFPSLRQVQLTPFIFYTAAGVYFAGIYVLRGFGIVVLTHAVYDVMVVLLQIRQGQA